MDSRHVLWLPVVRDKLVLFRNTRFTPEETFDFISRLVLEIEDQLKNPIIGGTYTEEFGKYKGISRIVLKKFRIYFQQFNNEIIIVAILFPGEK
ncbi:hypothetical protein BTR25_26470 [Bacillus sp. MRMR6]|nr:hypothetical protein BTR25_26470 [Bacillus sp. MRMR6]